MISSVDLPFRAMSLSPFESLEIAGFETYAWPRITGAGQFTAVSERDVFVMQNLVFLYAVVFVILNIFVDIIIAWLDPRIRYQ